MGTDTEAHDERPESMPTTFADDADFHGRLQCEAKPEFEAWPASTSSASAEDTDFRTQLQQETEPEFEAEPLSFPRHAEATEFPEVTEPPVSEQTDPREPEQVEDNDEPFARLQAILAGLPMHAVPPMPEGPGNIRSCASSGALVGQCTGCRRKASAHDLHTCRDRVEIALRRACVDYPDQEQVLRQLEVEHASLDLVCFVDHHNQRLFTAARGTDRALNPLTTPRDLSNDSLIAIGLNPYRSDSLAAEYRQVRAAFPFYASFGSGHSLGGNIVQAIAMQVEADELMRFERIDVFNFGSTPFRFSPVKYSRTEHHVHRVPGDWASAWYQVPDGCTDRLHMHPPKPHVRSLHVLGHFLPDKVVELRPAMLPSCPEEGQGISDVFADSAGADLGFQDARLAGPSSRDTEFVFGSALGNALRPVDSADWPKSPLVPAPAECQSGILQPVSRKPSWFITVMSSFNCIGSRNKDCASKVSQITDVQESDPMLVD